jgi:Tol biopolymer transport system component
MKRVNRVISAVTILFLLQTGGCNTSPKRTNSDSTKGIAQSDSNPIVFVSISQPLMPKDITWKYLKPVWNIEQMKDDGTDRSKSFDSDLLEFDPAISPNQQDIAFAAPAYQQMQVKNIYKANISDGYVQQLTHFPDHVIAAGPDWSPDGEQLVFFTTTSDPDAIGYQGDKIYIMRTDGTVLKVLGEGMYPHWSPDGTKILYTANEIKGTRSKLALWLMDSEGHNDKKIVTKGFSGASSFGVWSPSGDQIAFLGSERLDKGKGRIGIYVFGLRELKPSLLLSIPSRRTKDSLVYGSTVERPTGLQWPSKNKLIYTLSTLNPNYVKESAIFSLDIGQKIAKRLSKTKSMDWTQGYASLPILDSSVFAANLNR